MYVVYMNTCAFMEREARNVQEKQYAGNRNEQVCQISKTNTNIKHSGMKRNRTYQ